MSIASHFLAAKRKLYLGGGLLLLALSLLIVGGIGSKVSAAATDCDDNSIISCGASSPSDFISKAKANDSKNGHHDLTAIYDHYGLEPSEYDRFVSTARSGTAYSNGRIVVDGQTVATDAKSVGRIASAHGSGYFTTSIPGGPTLYGNTTSKTFNADSIPVMVMFNSQGQVEFAVLNSCGNPIYGTNVQPTYSCNALHESAVSGQPGTYSFNTDASAGNNASIVKVVYDFGDGTTKTETNPTTVINHTYTQGKTYTAKVTVYVSLPGNQTITITPTHCTKTFTVALPYFSCAQFNGAILDASKYSYSFTASANFGNGASFTSADFNFGDKTPVVNVAATGTSATTKHTYATAGTYEASATLHFIVAGNTKNVQNVTCAKAILSPTQPPTPECKPGVPQGSALCSPCQYNANVPASDTTNCVAPTTSLPNTGAGDVIAIFGAVAVGGFLIFRQLIYRRTAMATIGSNDPLGGPVVSPETGVVVGHHIRTRSLRHHRPNAARPLHHPHYQQPHRFRPRFHHDDQD